MIEAIINISFAVNILAALYVTIGIVKYVASMKKS